MDHLPDDLVDVAPFEHALPHAVELVALDVHHLVVLEEVLAREVVSLLDLLLRALDRAGEHAALDRLAVGHADFFEDVHRPLGHEHLQQVVLERAVEPRRAGIALAAGAAAELVVDAATGVALGADDVQAAGGFSGRRELIDEGEIAVVADLFLLAGPAPLERVDVDLPVGRVGLSVDHVPLRLGHELDVRAAAGHVRGRFT